MFVGQDHQSTRFFLLSFTFAFLLPLVSALSSFHQPIISPAASRFLIACILSSSSPSSLLVLCPFFTVMANETSVRYLCPSEIRYMHPVGPALVPDQTRLRDIDLTEYARRLAKHSAVYPRVQVVEAAGKFYATNHLNLALCRYLERAGYCRQVRVTVCPACSIPASLRAVLDEDQREEGPEAAGEYLRSQSWYYSCHI